MTTKPKPPSKRRTSRFDAPEYRLALACDQLRSVVRDPKAMSDQRIRAQTAIDKLFDLEDAP